MKKLLRLLLCVALAISFLSINTIALTPIYSVSSYFEESEYYIKLTDIDLTGNQAQDIASVALSQEGYHEGSNEEDIAGDSTSSGNYTEYGYWFGKQLNWCAIFVSWCARQAGVPESVIKTNSLASGNECHFGEKKYDFGSRAPQVGDILYIDNDSDPDADHVALVYKVDDEFIYSIEGNCSQKVYALKYNISDGSQTYKKSTKIIFYGVPDYQDTSKPKELKGDVNSDSLVNSTDALMILECSVGSRLLDDKQKAAADYNDDGYVNSLDALKVLQKATGLI